jgi:hypothetical protein
MASARILLELAQVITERAQPGRIDIVQAKQHLLGELSYGQPRSAQVLIASVANLLGTEPLGHPQISLLGRDSVKDVVTAEHPSSPRSAPTSPPARHWPN